VTDERTVQVPVSLAQRILLALRVNTPQSTRVHVGTELQSLLPVPLTPDDMAPGTTFRGRTPDGVLSHEDRLWMVTDDGYLLSTGGHHIVDRRIDPSTVRDVTPPAVTA
jgi:hypothetical protein